MKKIQVDLILIFLIPIMLIGLIFLVPMHLALYYEYGKTDFLFMLFSLLFADLVYIIYLRFFYIRIRSVEGFEQIKNLFLRKRNYFL